MCIRDSGYITIINPKNGSVSVSDDWADEDQKITLTITPDKGYVVDKIEIVDAEGCLLYTSYRCKRKT